MSYVMWDFCFDPPSRTCYFCALLFPWSLLSFSCSWKPASFSLLLLLGFLSFLVYTSVSLSPDNTIPFQRDLYWPWTTSVFPFL